MVMRVSPGLSHMGKQMKAKDVKCYYLCPKNFSRSCDDVLGCEDAVEKETCNCDKESLRRVLNLQKRAARVILNAPPLAPSVPLFNGRKWLPTQTL